MSSSIEDLKFHLVFATKYRYNFLNEKIANILKNYFLKKQEKYDFTILSLAIETNHVHLLIKLKSSEVNLNNIIQKIKGGSSFLIRKKFSYLKRYPSLWTESHFCNSVGNVSQETINNYINSQGIQEKEVVSRTFKFKVLVPTKYKGSVLQTYFQECLSNKRDKTSSAIFQDFPRINRLEGEFGLYIRSQASNVTSPNTKLAKHWIKIPGSHSQKPIWLGLQGRDLPEDCRIKDSTIRCKEGVYYVYLNIEQDRIILRATAQKILALDLGMNHPITSVMLEDDHMSCHEFYGNELKNQITKRVRRHSQLQHSGIENPTSKHQNRIDESLHEYVNSIIQFAKSQNCPIVVGDLHLSKKFTRGNSNQKTRTKGNRIPYFKIQELLYYKALLNNIPLVFVNEAYTSQTCSRCGNVDPNNRKGEHFHCRSCGYQNQADLNGAINIGRKLVGLLSSSYPTLRESFCETNNDVVCRNNLSECKPMASAMGR
jgi:putative transposase